MTSVAMNNLWNYIQGLSLSARNRAWLASKLTEPDAQQQRTKAETMAQQTYVRDSLTRAFDEMHSGKQMQSAEDFLTELERTA